MNNNRHKKRLSQVHCALVTGWAQWFSSSFRKHKQGIGCGNNGRSVSVKNAATGITLNTILLCLLIFCNGAIKCAAMPSMEMAAKGGESTSAWVSIWVRGFSFFFEDQEKRIGERIKFFSSITSEREAMPKKEADEAGKDSEKRMMRELYDGLFHGLICFSVGFIAAMALDFEKTIIGRRSALPNVRDQTDTCLARWVRSSQRDKHVSCL